MKVLVTGASGFIGRHTVPYLLAAGSEVHSLDIHTLPAELGGVKHHIVDLSDHALVRRLLSELRPSHLLHFAWHVPPGEFWTSRGNVQCLHDSLQLLTAFLDFGGVRSVVAGTCAEYDWIGSEALREDCTRVQPATLYGASKAALQFLHANLASRADSSFAWGRIFHLYGPYEPPSRFIPSVIRSLLAGQPAKCTHGRQIRDFMHVDDVARAFVQLLLHSSQGAVNIASGRGVTIADIAYQIADLIGRPDLIQLGALPAPASDPASLVADVDRLSHMGFTPTYSLEQGLAQTIEWWGAKSEIRYDSYWRNG
jgi:nucleoside-diphosphate-sugar epimerase